MTENIPPDLLNAAAWDAGADAAWSAMASGHHYPDNPYSQDDE